MNKTFLNISLFMLAINLGFLITGLILAIPVVIFFALVGTLVTIVDVITYARKS